MKVKSATRVTQILELLSNHQNGLQHKEIAEILDIPKGSLTKLLGNLADSRYLSFDRNNKIYKLGARVLTLANAYLSSLDIVQVAQPIVRNLVEKTGEAASLAVLDGDVALVVHRQYGNQPMAFRMGVGARIPLYATSSGKVLLAFLPRRELDAYLSSVQLKPLTHTTITDPSLLLSDLETVRSGGFAYCRQEQFEGLTTIAAPIFRLDGRVTASLAIMYLNIREPTIDLSLIKRALREASIDLSSCLGFQGRFEKVHPPWH